MDAGGVRESRVAKFLEKKMAPKSKPSSDVPSKKKKQLSMKLEIKRCPSAVGTSSPKDKATTPKSKKLSQTMREIIEEAIESLNGGRGGSSLQGIKKYIKEFHDIDLEKNNKLFLKTLRKSVAEGTIVQLKGVGANGSFRLAKVSLKTTTRTSGKRLEAGLEQPKQEKKAAKNVAQKTAPKAAKKNVKK